MIACWEERLSWQWFIDLYCCHVLQLINWHAGFHSDCCHTILPSCKSEITWNYNYCHSGCKLWKCITCVIWTSLFMGTWLPCFVSIKEETKLPFWQALKETSPTTIPVTISNCTFNLNHSRAALCTVNVVVPVILPVRILSTGLLTCIPRS